MSDLEIDNNEEKEYDDMPYTSLDRTLCEVLEEMRELHTTRNYSSMLGLIEEAQSMGNRMEAAIATKKSIIELATFRSKIKKEIQNLINKRTELIAINKALIIKK